MAAKVTLFPPKQINGTVAHLPGVQAAVSASSEEIGAKARGNLAIHRLTGHARIEVEHSVPSDYGDYGDIDAVVWLVDQGGDAAAIEFGHRHNRNRKVWVEGKYIVTGAAGLA